MHSSRMRTVHCSGHLGGGACPGGCTPPHPVDRQTLVKILPRSFRSQRGSLANSVAKELERLKKKSTVAQAKLIEEETSQEGNVNTYTFLLSLFVSVVRKTA